MEPQNYSPQEVARLIKSTIITRIKRKWFNLFVVGALFYVATQKTVNVEFTIGASSLFNDQQSFVVKDSKPLEQVFSLGNFSFTSKNNPHETKSTVKRQNSKQNQSVSEINSKLAYAFVFFDDPSGKHSIDQTLIDFQKQTCSKYIRRFAPVAVSEMKKFGIPASIKIAQAILESNAGQSQISNKLNNHFGIPCFSKICNAGHCVQSSDSSHKSFYRKYENAWTSFRAHSLFITQGPYQQLKQLGTSDYKAWAKALKELGYSNDAQYAEKLIRIIEGLALHQLDQ